MPLDIEKYKPEKKKRTLKRVLKIKCYKFCKRYEKEIVGFIMLIIFAVIGLYKPAQVYTIRLLDGCLCLLLWILPIIAFFTLIGICSYFYFLEKDYNLKLESNDIKINFKKGFNRLNVAFVVLCTIFFFFCISTWQYSEYKNFEKNNIKFYDIKTKKEIKDVCNNFPNKSHTFEYYDELPEGFELVNEYNIIPHYYIKEVTPRMCICENVNNDSFELNHKKDIYIKTPNNIQKVKKMFKCFLILLFLFFMFYSIMRLIYIGFVKIIEWFIKGFNQ